MKLDWKEVERLRKPSKKEIIETIDELDDAALDEVFAEYVESEIDPKLRLDQKEHVRGQAKDRFRKRSGTSTTVLELIEDLREYVARWSPTELP